MEINIEEKCGKPKKRQLDKIENDIKITCANEREGMAELCKGVR